MNSVVVDITIIRRLAKNPELRKRLPCLEQLTTKTISTPKKGCKKCSKQKQVTEVDIAQELELKKCLYRSSGEAKEQIKTVLGKDHLIFYFDAAGLPPRVTI